MTSFPAGFVQPVYKFRFHRPKVSIYSTFYVAGSKRAKRTPRILQHWRTRKLMSLTAFFRNRFYEMDRWYKARIDKPIIYPTCYIIEPDDFTQSLAERLADLELKRELIDIGLPYQTPKTSEIVEDKKVFVGEKELEELERLARRRKLTLPVGELEKNAAYADRNIKVKKFFAEHYNIFKDLFHEDAYFHPVVDLRVLYPGDEETVNPVFYGNTLHPRLALTAPEINYDAERGSLWTLLFTNPDGNVFEEKKEVLHWMICNIPENKIDQGELVCDYLQPLPSKNTGWHRMVFVLLKQNERLDCSKLKLPYPCDDLRLRTFSTPEFYLKNENSLTPAGLAFFQTEWDHSCTECFHQRLNLEQPLYSFEWPEPYFEPQEEFPSHSVPFNLYLDNYRDYKDIDKEIFTKRLKRISPYRADEPRSKFENIFVGNIYYKQQDLDRMPTWIQVEKIKENEGYGKYAGIYKNPLN